jgi:hypothetical protein
MQVTMEWAGGETVRDPKREDFDRALALPRDDDWFLELWLDENDSLEAMMIGESLQLECCVGDKYERAQSPIDDEKLKAMLVDFAAGGSAWRAMTSWAEPPRASAGAGAGPRIDWKSPQAIAGIAFGVLMIAAIVFGGGAWAATVFALAFPGIIALAAYVKMREADRAAKWTKANAKVLRAELVTRTVHGKPAQVPDIEYEFTVGMDFDKVRGNRVTLAEIIGPEETKRMMSQYRVGTSVPVYYDPANPKDSVIERDVPRFVFHAGFGFAAFLALAILAGAWWFLIRGQTL